MDFLSQNSDWNQWNTSQADTKPTKTSQALKFNQTHTHPPEKTKQNQKQTPRPYERCILLY